MPKELPDLAVPGVSTERRTSDWFAPVTSLSSWHAAKESASAAQETKTENRGHRMWLLSGPHGGPQQLSNRGARTGFVLSADGPGFVESPHEGDSQSLFEERKS